MLVCGNCYRLGKRTVFLVLMAWRYRILKSGEDGFIFLLDEEIHMPNDIGEELSSISAECARCGNDFPIPKSWIRRKEKMLSFRDIKVKPICTDCRNTQYFIVVGDTKYFVQVQGHLMSLRSIIDNDQVNQTDRGIVRLITGLLRDEEYRTPIICRECNSDRVDLVPIDKGEEYVDRERYDAALAGSINH